MKTMIFLLLSVMIENEKKRFRFNNNCGKYSGFYTLKSKVAPSSIAMTMMIVLKYERKKSRTTADEGRLKEKKTCIIFMYKGGELKLCTQIEFKRKIIRSEYLNKLTKA